MADRTPDKSPFRGYFLSFPFFSKPFGRSASRLAACLASRALCASEEPEEFFFGFLSPIGRHVRALQPFVFMIFR